MSRVAARQDASRADVAEALGRPGERLVVTAHHNPDGDAIGSMLGLARALRAAGQDVVLAHPDPEPVPSDLAFLVDPGERILPAPPDDLGERVLVAVDCASEHRLWHEPVHEGARLVVNIDHHHDNTRFGDLNLVEPLASSSAEVVAGRDRGGRLAADGGGRDAPLRRPRHRHGPLRLLQHRPGRPPPRRGAHRGRR